MTSAAQLPHILAHMRTRWKGIYSLLLLWIAATIVFNPQLFLSQFVSGFVYGMILVMIALGLSLILGLMGVVNFAHGALFMLGGYFAFAAVAQLGLPFWTALIIAPICVGIAGAAIEVLTLRPLYSEEPIVGLLLTFGLTLMIDEVVRFTWGSRPLSYDIPQYFSQPLSLGLISISVIRVFTVAIGVLSVLLLYLMIVRTDFGLTIRAGVQDVEMTEMVGVNLPIRFTATFMIGSMIAGLAGVLRTAEVGLSPDLGASFIVLAFVVIVVGGIGSLFGSVIAGLLIGWAQFLTPGMLAAAAYYTGVELLTFQGFSRVVPFIVMIVVLLDRPRGLFGRTGLLE